MLSPTMWLLRATAVNQKQPIMDPESPQNILHSQLVKYFKILPKLLHYPPSESEWLLITSNRHKSGAKYIQRHLK